MNHLQKQILFFLEECNRERCVSKIAEKYDKNLEVVRAELVILANKNLIAIKKSTTGKISRATISPKGKQCFREATAIVTKASVQGQINELKQKLSALEASFLRAQENPTGENKQSLLDNANTVHSVANGLNSFFKVGMDIFK
ncbi:MULTISPECIES: hypothetical protein [Peribacillus]|uniref:Uncharacterized protein n=1 Tax=Peribacillus simplex TaxID=1478 RepID=A0A9W4KXU6_9BACI|nr:hypothetical protein [Peribacillus simplex]MDR4929629.1 hypothetical protein [Peribacillus simplex]WHX90637.1 hypothetical protein QNH50_22000 [Peribacillus simplex]CAH0235212.1 hypothetical protein SRABI133_02741 [Peribacillus simplex]